MPHDATPTEAPHPQQPADSEPQPLGEGLGALVVRRSRVSRAVVGAFRAHAAGAEVELALAFAGAGSPEWRQALDIVWRDAAALDQNRAVGEVDEGAVAALEVETAAVALRIEADRHRARELGAKVMKRALEQAEADRPANWPGDGSPSWSEIVQFMASSGWPVIWVPGQPLLERLVAAAPGSEDAELESSSGELLEACEEALQQVTGTDISTLTPGAMDAVRAAQAELWRPTQAMAAAVLDTALQVHCGYTLGGARDVDHDPDRVPSPFHRYGYVMSCMPHSLQNYYPKGGDPIPTTFNRHASVHAVSSEQYTKVNALVALIYMTSLVREVHELQVTGDWSTLAPGA